MNAKFVEDVDGVLVPAPDTTRTTKSRDAYVVDAAPLADALHSFVAGWTRTHPRHPEAKDRIAARRPEVAPISAVDWLTASSGVPQATIQNFLRRDEAGHPSPRYATTDLQIADALLTAVGRPDILVAGDLNVRRRGARRSLTGEG